MQQANLLIVDDDPIVRLDLKKQLSGMGHTIVGETDSGGQALMLARSLRPDLVLLDIILSPGISGIEVAKALCTERACAVLLFTGNPISDLMDHMNGVGVTGFLSKPLRDSDLAPAIHIAISRFREMVTLENEVKNLEERMEARKLVGRAKAILMERHGLTEREAFHRIQGQSVALNRAAHEIARAIITASEIAA